MSKRGPKRLVTEAVRIGEYGKTSWHIVLECGHSIPLLLLVPSLWKEREHTMIQYVRKLFAFYQLL